MKILDESYFDKYFKQVGNQLKELIQKQDFNEKKIEFGYATRASAVFSSNIEGNTVDLNSYMNYELTKEKFKPTKEIEEINNLVTAYLFAQTNELNEDNFLECHKIFSKTLLIKRNRGKYRTEKVGVYDEKGLVYLAVEPEYVQEKMGQLFGDIIFLLRSEISIAEIFYYASLIHLKFVHIHPFRDGNGRGGRLLEKWFISQKLGENFWKIPSEKYYWDHRDDYYNNINIGVNYYELNYDCCFPFLIMLPECLR